MPFYINCRNFIYNILQANHTLLEDTIWYNITVSQIGNNIPPYIIYISPDLNHVFLYLYLYMKFTIRFNDNENISLVGYNNQHNIFQDITLRELPIFPITIGINNYILYEQEDDDEDEDQDISDSSSEISEISDIFDDF